ncbi:predicted protein [Nematostella vectensis]|uniref:Uncharacterized protein n=1 Tax=Nematostella vectensis TaxID=45351 RepID=A7SGF6_NEMVE|nr:LHFPL tetraspan subfamily member 3 protein [Nematostella vectensis]EDO37179.1 predicted protein [Nematostella vectensis]|eukprot:XP_001629242.1 predicted protein [Nematostella vectensis]
MPCFALRKHSFGVSQSAKCRDHEQENREEGDSEQGDKKEEVTSPAAMFRNGRPYKSWYKSRSRSILVALWSLCTIFIGIMIVVVFVQAQWLGGKDSASGLQTDFGLYRSCTGGSTGRCSGELNHFSSIPSSAWKAATIFVLFAFISIFGSLVVVFVYSLCCLNKSGLGFRFCSGLQAFSGCCLMLACLIYPSGWDAPTVRAVCGSSAGSYQSGSCDVKWSYWVALVCMFDAFILSFLSLMFIEKEGFLKTLKPKRKNISSFTRNGISSSKNNNGTKNTAFTVDQEDTHL